MPQRMDVLSLADWLAEQRTGERLFIAIAGAPGAGKSTVAVALVEHLNAICPGSAALLPMDGYHFDDRVLAELGRQARKGAPDTFDVGGLRQMLMRLRTDREDAVAVPVFDRDIEIARAGARLIPAPVRIIVVEGNYLLLDKPPWDTIGPLFDITVMLEVSAKALRERLEQRWRNLGLSEEEIRRKVEENDVPNGEMVMRESLAPDVIISN